MATPLILLQLNEPSGSTSFTNSGSVGGTWTTSATPPTSGATGILGNGVSFPGTQSNYIYLIGDSASRAVEPTQVTMICWIYLLAEATGSNYVHLFSKAYYSNDEWSNGEPYVALELTIPRNALNPAFTVTTSGARNTLTAPQPISLNFWHQIALTYDGTTLTGYIDGVSQGTMTLNASIDYGTHGDWLCGGNFPPYFEAEVLDGTLDQLAVYNNSFTSQQVFLDYLTTWNTHYNINPIPIAYPTVENVIPSTGSNIQPGQIIQFDVTTTNMLKRVFVLIKFNSLNIYEVCHDGTAFAPNYNNVNCMRNIITNGYRYTILRSGGWPDAPTIVADAFDTSGGED